MPTKADLQDELDQTTLAYEEFRKQVVKKALSEARRNGWCRDVIKILHSLGLQEEIPTLYWIQWKTQGGRRWYYYDGSHRTLASARKDSIWSDPDYDAHRIISEDGYGNLIKVHDEIPVRDFR